MATMTCRTCAHYGCCDDLHNCGGRYWEKAEPEPEYDEDGEEIEREEHDPWEGYDEYDEWEARSESYQEMMDRKY